MHSIGTALLLVVAFAFTGCAAASENGDGEVDALGLECFTEELPSDPCGACGDNGVCLELRPSIVTPDGSVTPPGDRRFACADEDAIGDSRATDELCAAVLGIEDPVDAVDHGLRCEVRTVSSNPCP